MMKFPSFLVVFSILFSAPLFAEERKATRLMEETSLSGQQLAMIEVAVLELKKHDRDFLSYQLFLYRADKSYVVIFDDPKRSLGQGGSSQHLPTFEVEMNDDLKVLKSNFSR